MFVLHIYSVDKDWQEYFDYISTTITNGFFSGIKKGAILEENWLFPKREIILVEKKKL
jgi:hypothetical protein